MGRSLQLPYTNEEKFWPNKVQTLVSDHLVVTFWVVAYERFERNTKRQQWWWVADDDTSRDYTFALGHTVSFWAAVLTLDQDFWTWLS